MKVLSVVLLIFGTIVGSGFSSGKEIFVFFSRFGAMSYVFIALACIIFFCLFYLFLSRGKFVIEKLEKSKILSLIIIFISVIFCSSMFAGLKSLFSFLGGAWYVVFCAGLLFLAVFVAARGIGVLVKINVALMPICAFVFLAVLTYICLSSGDACESASSFGLFFCPLYVALNFSTSVFVICRAGESLSKKQVIAVSLILASLLFVFLTFGNFALRSHGESFAFDMPFLSLCASSKFFFVLCYLVIMLGCLTTLLSLTVTLSLSVKTFVKGDLVRLALSVFLPFLISELGFSAIVSFLYPLCSVLGIFVLLFFIFSLYKADDIIHEKGKDAKNKR